MKNFDFITILFWLLVRNIRKQVKAHFWSVHIIFIVFWQFPFRWIYYYGSNKSTRKETGKMHLCFCFSRGPHTVSLTWILRYTFFFHFPKSVLIEDPLYLGLNAKAEIQILNSICNLDALALIGVIIAQRSLSPCIFLLI